MIGGKKGRGTLNGFLDRGARFEGTLFFEDTFRIDGVLKGKVVTKNELIIGDGAAIDAEIHVGRLSVSGTVKAVRCQPGFSSSMPIEVSFSRVAPRQ